MRGLPIRYSIRNLARRPGRTTLTVAGLSLVVALVVFLAAFARSIGQAVRVTGDPRNLVVVSKKAQSMELSSIPAGEMDLLRNDVADQVEEGPDGPLFSREVFRFEQVRLGEDETKVRAKIHGIDPALAEPLLAGFRRTAGDLPDAGYAEIMVGRRVAEDLGVPDERLRLEEAITIGEVRFTIVGRFEAPGSLVEHWMIAPEDVLREAIRRSDYSFARMRVRDGVDLDDLARRLSLDEQYQVRVLRETEYFADFARGFGHFQRFSLLLALVLAAGGVLTGMNTMHNAVSGRIREIGVLRVLGFGKAKIGAAFALEVLLLCGIAGLVGCTLGWLGDGLPMRLPFAAAFPVRVDGFALATGFLGSMAMGLLGLAFPLLRALRLPAVETTRAVG